MQTKKAYILIFFIIFIPFSIISILADINIVLRWFIFLSGLYIAGMTIFTLNEAFHKNYVISTVLETRSVQTVNGKIRFSENKVPVKVKPDRVFFADKTSCLEKAEVRYGFLRATKWVLYITPDDIVALADV